MNNAIIKAFAGIALLAAGTGMASATLMGDPTTIADNYQGSDDHGWGDRIGASRYEISSMDVVLSDGYLNVRVNTNFNSATDPYGIDFGDLFISNNGWNPYGSAPYAGDHAGNGESWELVFDTSENMLYGGEFSIDLSEDVMGPGYIYRNGQEVQRAGGGTALGGSSVNLANAGYGGYVEYNILMSSLGLTGNSIGLKWGMTCANDTIEGSYEVPEPHALLLLGAGLLGLGIARRKKA